jgi:hypothetical protein
MLCVVSLELINSKDCATVIANDNSPRTSVLSPHRTKSSWTAFRRYLQFGVGHFLMYTCGRLRPVRSLVVWVYSRRHVDTPTISLSLVEDVDVDLVVRTMGRDGIFSGLRLCNDAIEELRAFSLNAICFGDGNPDFPFRYADKEAAELQHARTFRLGRLNQALSACPALRTLTSDAKLLQIARKYLGTEPVLVGARMWWSFPGPADALQQMQAGQGFHYDIDGYRALAFFFYLTDVGPSDGPHVYIRGSHVDKSLKHLFSVHRGRSDVDIDSYYGPDRHVTLCGPAGFGFAEDIFGFHRGSPSATGDRLLVQVRYGLRDYGAGHAD